MPHVPDYQSKLDPGTEITRYIRTWKEYRKRRWISFGVLAMFPLVVVGMTALEVAGASFFWKGTLFFGWGLSVGVTDWWRNSIRCPRCGQLFFRRQGSVMGSRCRSCKLPKWATYNVPRTQ